MEELGFSIAVPETMLLGFGIMVILGVIILVRVLKIARIVENTYDEVDNISERVSRIEKTLEKIQERKD